MALRRGRNIESLLASKLTGGEKEKEFDFSQLNPMEWEFLSGDRKLDPKGTWENIKDYWGSDDEDMSLVRDYTQKGGDASVAEGLYNQSMEEMDQPYGSTTKGPKLPYEMWEPGMEMPEFAKSQQKFYKDPEMSERQAEEKRVLAKMALAQQTPSLAPAEAGILEKLLGQDKDPSLAHVGGAMAEVGEDPNTLQNRFPTLNLAGITDRVKAEEEGRGYAKSLGYGSKEKKPWDSLAILDGSSAKQLTGTPHDDTAPSQSLLSASDDYDVSGDDDMGFATDSTVTPSDSGRDDSLAQEKKDNDALAGKIGAAAKLYSLLQPEQQQSAPSIPVAKISRGSVAFPGMKLASHKERRKYFTPKGLMA